MLTTLFSFICALSLSAASITAPSDTIDRYIINEKVVADFDGSQLVGKTISDYKIQSGYEHKETVRVHIITTSDYNKPGIGNITVISSGEMAEGQIRLFKTSDSVEEPIVVLDGKVISQKEFTALKPSDIESIEIIKEEANEIRRKYTDKEGVGVILVTTKKK